MLYFATMVLLKALNCLVICFGLVQSNYIQNVLLKEVLQSNVSSREKLEEVNKIVSADLQEPNLQITLSRKCTSSLDLARSGAQLPLHPTSPLWNPTVELEKPKPSFYENQKPSHLYNPWGNIKLRSQNSVLPQYKQPTRNRLNQQKSQSNFYYNAYRQSPNRYSQKRINSNNIGYYNVRSKPYNFYSTGMKSPSSFRAHLGQLPSSLPAASPGNNPAMPARLPWQLIKQRNFITNLQHA